MSNGIGERSPGGLAVHRSTIGDGVVVVALDGYVDADSSDVLSRALAESTSAPGVVVDFAKVGFMDSTGVRVLVGAHQALQENGGWMRVAAVSYAVTRVLTIIGVDSFIPLFPTVEDALKS